MSNKRERRLLFIFFQIPSDTYRLKEATPTEQMLRERKKGAHHVTKFNKLGLPKTLYQCTRQKTQYFTLSQKKNFKKSCISLLYLKRFIA